MRMLPRSRPLFRSSVPASSMRLLACRTFATLVLASAPRWQGPSLVRSFSTSPSALDSDGKKKQPRSIAGSKSPRPRPPPPRTTRTAATDSVLHSAKPSAAPRRPGSSPSHGERERSYLQPYELSRRLITLCESGDVDLAVTTLQSAPRNAQNIKVWNTLVQQCMNAKKYKLAYSVFTDVCPPLVIMPCHFRHIRFGWLVLKFGWLVMLYR